MSAKMHLMRGVMIIDYEHCGTTGRVEFFDCQSGRTVFRLPACLAWAAPLVWRMTWRAMRKRPAPHGWNVVQGGEG